MAHHTLLDTCIWLDLAADPQAAEIIDRIDDLIATTQFRLVVPQITREEFDRHKGTYAEKLAQSLKSRVKETTGLVKKYAPEAGKAELLAGLNGFLLHVGDVSKAAGLHLTRIEKLLDHAETKKLESSEEILRKAAERGVRKQAPFQGNKNSVADAVILEAYLAFHSRHKPDHCTFSFVTVNKSDFADQKDQRRPHPELGEPFSSGAIRYCINLAEEVNRLTDELPPAPQREKQHLPEAVVRRVDEWGDFWDGVKFEPAPCPKCKAKALYDFGWRGMTWHKRCAKCGEFFDVGIHMDDD